jgi:hypothetical protein
MGEPGLTLAQIFDQHFDDYRARFGVSLQQWRVVQALRQCRTAALGWHERVCDHCGHTDFAYNSCHNRHCPKCQWTQQQAWVAHLLTRLPPVSLFHLVFTLPDDLNPLLRLNQRVLYDVLFQAASQTLLTFGHDPRRLGAKMGVLAVLHTWGQTLNYHVHLHCLVTAGGLAPDDTWRFPKSRDRFLFPVRALSQVFRAKFLHYLRQAFAAGHLHFAGQIADLAHPMTFAQFTDHLARKLFFIYAKAPFAAPTQVVEYLGRYTHRVAISHARLRTLTNGQVTFTYKDNRQDGRPKIMSLSAVEFIRRFLAHVLPPGFKKIRYYGLFANAAQAQQLPAALLALAAASPPTPTALPEPAPTTLAPVCPTCLQGLLRVRRVVFPWSPQAGALLAPLIFDTS